MRTCRKSIGRKLETCRKASEKSRFALSVSARHEPRLDEGTNLGRLAAGREAIEDDFDREHEGEDDQAEQTSFPEVGGVDSEEIVAVWDCANGCDGAAIFEARECVENRLFADRKTFQSDCRARRSGR